MEEGILLINDKGKICFANNLLKDLIGPLNENENILDKKVFKIYGTLDDIANSQID
jgi:sensor histidine kinase regulating citrate/malate metabolism